MKKIIKTLKISFKISMQRNLLSAPLSKKGSELRYNVFPKIAKEVDLDCELSKWASAVGIVLSKFV